MPKACALGLTLLLLGLYLMTADVILAETADAELGAAEKLTAEAFRLLQQGLQEGGDASDAKIVADKLNIVISLVDRSPSLGAAQVRDAAMEAVKLANSFYARSRDIGLVISIITWTVVPVTSLIISVLILWFREWYVNRSNRLLLRLVVTVKDKGENDEKA